MLRDVTFPPHRHFKSRTEWEPIGFFSDCLCNATQFDLMLGFFSSSAINVLADGFASFLYNGGHMNLIVNDILTKQDKEAITSGANDTPIPFFDIHNIEKLKNTLSKRDTHFFDCIAWLIRNNRIEIKIVCLKDGLGISHTKTGVFCDGVDKVGFDGSCNFSRSALIDNIESLTAFCDWDSGASSATIDKISDDFDLVFKGQDKNVTIVQADQVKTRIANCFKDRELIDLLRDENDIIQKDITDRAMPASVVRSLYKAKNKVEAEIEKLKEQEVAIKPIDEESPAFPYASGARDYQKQAFENWKRNNQKGLFAMATGTGKTITSLNCLLEIYKKSGYYKAIILVPTITLVEQWEIECRKFNFRHVIKVCSKYNNWKSDVATIRLREMTNACNDTSYIIIATYASFVRSNVFTELNQFPKSKLLLIADEAHNMGGGLMAKRLSDIKYLRRIGLSATPERQFDEEGNQKLMSFFGCENGYTFEYSMAEAIQNGALCRYYYYPHIVRLTASEMSEYVDVSQKIVKIMGYRDKDSQQRLTMLMLKRKRIIHKASNKLSVFKQIVEQCLREKGNLKYTLVYAPEGNTPDNFEADSFDKSDTIETDADAEHMIDDFTRIVRDTDPHIIVRKFTAESSDREAMLKGFADGSIDVLTSMKCLDEGIDVPRSELAIFCASTGNPRQFIQRRGRVLRTHKDKRTATIHDLVVIPDNVFEGECYKLERNMVQNELRRVRDFALLSENLIDTDDELHEVLARYNLSIFN